MDVRAPLPRVVRGLGDRHDPFIRQPGHDPFLQPGVLEGEPALPLVIVCGQDPFEAAEGAAPVDGVGQAFAQALVAYREDEVVYRNISRGLRPLARRGMERPPTRRVRYRA
jgi:hypothetical protein